MTFNNSYDLATPSNTDSIDFFSFLAQQLPFWRIHRCQITDNFISQNQPMKLIYHYEQLDDWVKSKTPLQGQLLSNFDKTISREVFANLANINISQVAQPWQLKFVGKLVVYFEQPEIAMRLKWTNTIKPFAIVADKSLADAVGKSFEHWQFIDKVELIIKNPNILLTAEHPELTQPWQQSYSQVFLPVPAVLGLEIQQFLQKQDFVKNNWQAAMIDEAQHTSDQWLEQLSMTV